MPSAACVDCCKQSVTSQSKKKIELLPGDLEQLLALGIADWKTWPMHAKTVTKVNLAAIMDKVSPALASRFKQHYQYFSPQFLSSVQASGKQSRVELLPGDVEQLLASGIIEETDGEQTLTMHVFTVPETGKRRRRCICHTIDINDSAAAVEIELPDFLQIKHGHGPYTALADLSAWYYQIPLPQESRRYYRFSTGGKTYQLTAVPMGQRQAVGAAQTLSESLVQLAQLPTNVKTTTYIDNFRFAAQDPLSVKDAWVKFSSTCDFYNATLNVDSGIAGESYDFLGIHFTQTTMALTEKTLQKLTGALEELKHENLSLHQAIKIFGLFLFAARILNYPLALVYYTFKFFRRRGRAFTFGWRKLTDKANIWPCINDELQKWSKHLLDNTPVSLKEKNPTAVLITDASKWGWGAILFKKDGSLNFTNGEWSAEQRVRHINELEALAAKLAVSTLQPPEELIILIDNTTAESAIRKKRSTNYWINKIVADIPCLMVEHITSRSNVADILSRGQLASQGKAPVLGWKSAVRDATSNVLVHEIVNNIQ